jgi:radical SAM protein with 4Fe4S-binding SPASM domain
MSSICEQATGLDERPYWEKFSKSVLKQRVPFSGSLALTHRCNLRCIHCYAREDGAAPPPELEREEWQRIIRQVKEAGCLYLLLTGGEPLLRQDFAEIYSFIKKNGFLVTVFTNGTLVTDGIIELFRALPPRLVEISLYGATAATYDRITGVPGSFRLVRQGIEKLIANGIRVGLKSVMMKPNIDEFSAIEDLARGYGVNFRLDAAIFPTLDGNPQPLALRVSPEQAVALEMADPDRAREWREYFAKAHIVPYGKKAFACTAGMTNFHVDPDGTLFPCLIARSRHFSLKKGSFMEGWNGEIARLQEKLIPDGFACESCEKKLICGFCPGLFELEDGSGHAPSEYICATGKLRHEYIVNRRSGGK